MTGHDPLGAEMELEGEEVRLRKTIYHFCATALLHPDPGRVATLKARASWLTRHLTGPWPDRHLRIKLRGICRWYQGIQDEPYPLQCEWIRLFGASIRRSVSPSPSEGATVGPGQAVVVRARLAREYAEAGLVLPAGDRPDHVSVELGFMAFLSGLELEAIQQGRDDLRRSAIDRQRRFLDQHLCQWLPGLTHRVRACNGEIYTQICSAAEQLAAAELQRLERSAPRAPRQARGMQACS